MLNGTIKGDIYARERIVLGATARVEGNVYYGVIEMTLGAQIMGRLQLAMAEQPLSRRRNGGDRRHLRPWLMSRFDPPAARS